MLFALAHSPITGPEVWRAVAGELQRRGHEAIRPVLQDNGAPPYWSQHAALVLPDRELVLVGHSGAGPLLPAIAEGRSVTAYVFVDAGVPQDGQSHLDRLQAEDATLAARMRAHLDAGGRFPDWSDADLVAEVPDATLRRELVSGLRPRSLDYFAEPIPVPRGWPDAPCAYLRFSEWYQTAEDEARRRGWTCERLPGGHFHMLVAPAVVADRLIALAG